jgi:hypothetical protein
MAFERPLRGACRVLVSLLIGAPAWLEVAPAHACSCSDTFQNELRAGAGQIPANAGVPWWFTALTTRATAESWVSVERIEGAARVPVSAAVEPFQGIYVIRPREGWAAGERYRISVDVGPQPGGSDQRFRTAEVEITPALEATTPLALSTSAPERLQLSLVEVRGSCTATHDAAVVELSAGAPEGMQGLPLGILHFTTYVDGVPWRPSSHVCADIEPGTSWTGRASDRLVASCDEFAPEGASLAEGEHTVRMVARLPGTGVTFETPEQLVELSCDTNAVGDAADEVVGDAAVGDEAEETVTSGDGQGATGRNPVVFSESARGCSFSAARARGSRSSLGVSLALAALGFGWSRRARRID